jgi:hypothetical protein
MEKINRKKLLKIRDTQMAMMMTMKISRIRMKDMSSIEMTITKMKRCLTKKNRRDLHWMT